MGLIDNVKGLITENPLLAVGGAAAGGLVTGAAIATAVTTLGNKGSNSKKSGKRIKHTRRGWKQDRARRSKQKWEVAYQRRKRRKHLKRSRRGVHYTKNGQPYIILASGKAKFIKGRRRK